MHREIFGCRRKESAHYIYVHVVVITSLAGLLIMYGKLLLVYIILQHAMSS